MLRDSFVLCPATPLPSRTPDTNFGDRISVILERNELASAFGDPAQDLSKTQYRAFGNFMLDPRLSLSAEDDE
jgi:hypothetical protein